jgi:acetyl esterase/lipase
MSQDAMQARVTKTPVVYTMPGMDDVTVRRNQTYRVTDAGALTMDLYYPREAMRGTRTPAVIFVTGYSDPGAQMMFGCRLKDMASYMSWARLAATSGMVGITYANGDPAADVNAVLRHVRENAASLDIDETRIAVWSCSGNVPNALAVLMQPGQDFLKCAVLCYGLMLDLDESTTVAGAAAQFRFANTSAGKSVDDLPRALPLFVARAGRDEFPGLNDTMDRFLAAALRCNLPVTFVNHAEGPHAFDMFDNSDTSREIVKRILSFLQFHLLTAATGRATTTASPESASRTT